MILVYIDANYIVAHFGKTGTGDEAYVAGADDCDIHKYCIYVKRISVPADVDRKMKAHALAQVYADELEMMMRKYPAQWFNYFDFWKQ